CPRRELRTMSDKGHLDRLGRHVYAAYLHTLRLIRGYHTRCQGMALMPGRSTWGFSTRQARTPRAAGPARPSQRASPSAWRGVGVAVALASMPYNTPPRSMIRSTSAPVLACQ